MTNPRSNCQMAKEARSSNSKTTAPTARSVWECGGSPPLSPGDGVPSSRGARELTHSKTSRMLRFLCLLLAAFGLRVLAQYAIQWHTIDGGGGTSTGGLYAVTGTIGQPDAGAMSGGNFTLTGGFWAFAVAVQTPHAPYLTIVASGPGVATISWTPATPGFVLQESPGLAPAGWTNSPSGATNPVVVPAAGPTKFYRLHRP